MLLSKQKFDEICLEYGLTEDQVATACDVLHDILSAEANLTEAKYPYACNTTNRLNMAAYQVYEIGSDLSGDCFGEGEDSQA